MAKEYAIFDAFEAAILVIRGHPISYRNTGERTMFVFDTTLELRETVAAYRHRSLKVDAFTFAEAVKDIKREMYINKSKEEKV